MFWFAVRADGMGADGPVEGCAVGVELADGPDVELPGVADGAAGLADRLFAPADGPADADADPAKSDWLAGTSFRNDWKISLSCGWVHSTLAVSDGTTSDRG